MTPLSEVYQTFLSKISDYTYLNIPPSEVEIDLFGYLKSAIAKFYRCKNDLTIQTNSFASILTPFEIEILVTLMTAEYLKPQILTSEIIKQSLSDKDFKVYSQANHLQQLNLTFRMLRTEANKMITEYGYMKLGVEKL
jgi:hypothetical protein